jgi:hypothetical protein
VPFWDALDVVSLSAYFPLVKHRQPPTAQELDRAWQRIRREILAYGAAQNRRIVFMELGYDRSLDAAREPWASGKNEPGSEAIQALCLDRALAAVEAPDTLLGAFLWKWFPGQTHGEDFLVNTPSNRAVIARHWLPADGPITPHQDP